MMHQPINYCLIALLEFLDDVSGLRMDPAF